MRAEVATARRPRKAKAPAKRDHARIARSFETAVLNGTFPSGKLFRAAVERQRRDLERLKTDPGFKYRFDPEIGAKVVRFVEAGLVHVEGPETIVGKLIVLEPWQVWAIVVAWSWVSKVNSHPRFRRIVFFMPKGSGKTLLCAALALYTLATDKSGGRIISAATTRDQAKLAFRASRLMLVRAPGLAERFGLVVEEHRIVKPATGADYRPISAEAGGAEGQLPRLQVIDEIHAHPTRDLYDNLRSMAAKRPDSQMLVISTAGFDMSPKAIGYEVYCYARDVLLGTVKDDSQFALLIEADRDLDPWAPETWRQANPQLGVSIDAVEVENEANEARQVSSKQASFKTKRLGWWCQNAASWLDMEAWAKCQDDSIDWARFDGAAGSIGVDLAQTRDLTAKAHVFSELAEDGQRHYFVRCRAYLPAESPTLRDGQDTLRAWAADGALILTPGKAMDLGIIHDDVLQDLDTHPGSELCLDPWGAVALKQMLEQEGYEDQIVEIRQGARTQSDPMKEIEASVLTGRLHHDGNPVLTWCVGNVVARADRNGNIAPDRENDSKKIDAGVALINAMVRAMLGSESAYSGGQGLREL